MKQKIIQLMNYDRTNKFDILSYSRHLLGKSLSEAIQPRTIDQNFKGKGRLGQLVEKYFFGYDINSEQQADFSEAGVELKCTPLKILRDNNLHIKERLVCTMIDYSHDCQQSFEESHLYLKCATMLILFYLHEKNINVEDLKFLYSILWELPEKDLLIIKQDYDTIIAKIKAGKAHELSEGDTTYLGACRKGQKGDADVIYTLPNGQTGPFPAPKRAFSLKPQYMRTILEFAQKTGGQGTHNCTLSKATTTELTSVEELKSNSFEHLILKRFQPFYGKSYSEICDTLQIQQTTAKNRYAIVVNEILTESKKRGDDAIHSDEFQKSGIRLKTIRLKNTGKPKEAMSFENIKYFDILEETEWEESRLYDIFTSRFLFIIFQETDNEYQLLKAFFWTMPTADLNAAEKYWQNIKNNVAGNRIAPQYFYKESDHKKFHVRPKGRSAADLTDNPNGGKVKKYCYWLNKAYISEIIEKEG